MMPAIDPQPVAAPSVTLWVILAVFTAIGVLLLALSYRRGAAHSMMDRLERSLHLAIPEALRPLVGQRLLRRRRGDLAGTVLGLWMMVPIVWAGGEAVTTSPAAVILLLGGGSFAGRAVGIALGSLQWPTQRDDKAVRYARPGAVEVRDYLPPFERRGAWIATALAILFLVIAIALPSSSTAIIGLLLPGTAGIILIVLAIVSLGFFELQGRRIVRRAQPRASELELVWDDAMRSMDVRDLAAAPITFGLYGTFILGYGLLFELSNFASPAVAAVLQNIVIVLAIVAALGIFIYAIASLPERYFLKRLWSQYVDVGSPTALASGPETTDPES